MHTAKRQHALAQADHVPQYACMIGVLYLLMKPDIRHGDVVRIDPSIRQLLRSRHLIFECRVREEPNNITQTGRESRRVFLRGAEC